MAKKRTRAKLHMWIRSMWNFFEKQHDNISTERLAHLVAHACGCEYDEVFEAMQPPRGSR